MFLTVLLIFPLGRESTTYGVGERVGRDVQGDVTRRDGDGTIRVRSLSEKACFRCKKLTFLLGSVFHHFRFRGSGRDGTFRAMGRDGDGTIRDRLFNGKACFP